MRDEKIRELRAQGLSQRAIAARIGCSRGTVRCAIDADYAARKTHRSQSYYAEHHEELLTYKHQWLSDHRDHNKEQQRQNHAKRLPALRTGIFDHYGRECVCCGTAEDLCLDHVKGNGGDHRSLRLGGAHQSGQVFYGWLVRNDFPAECEPGGEYELQVLCKPCNSSKGGYAACRLDHEDEEAA